MIDVDDLDLLSFISHDFVVLIISIDDVFLVLSLDSIPI